VRMQAIYLLLLLLPLIIQKITGRSVHRPKIPSLPHIETRWLGQSSPYYTLSDSHLEQYPLFGTFNKKYFYDHLLPNDTISYRYNPKKSVRGTEIKQLIETLIKEIKQKKKSFTHFDVIRRSNFNRKKCSGLLIAKCKHHPFVVKMFMETPESFIMYNAKGFEPTFLFYMAGGINRHLLGFTRIKNLENINKLVASSKEWAHRITFPRKWFVLPNQPQWLEIKGDNIGKKKKQYIAIPATYCVVSDWIDGEKTPSIFNKDDRKMCMKLCNFLELSIDPHIDNFIIERSTKKIAIIDTEHFYTVVGIKKKKKFRGYFSWLTYLAGQCTHAMYFRNKADRKQIQLVQSKTRLRY